MIKSFEFTGRTEEEAINAAIAELKTDRDALSIEILERAKSGFLGIGSVPAKIKVSYEESASREEKIRDFLQGLLERMGTEAEIAVNETGEYLYSVNFEGKNMGALIGRRGETLDAIQHLANYAVNRGEENRVRISVDAENYRRKREEALTRLAEKVAGKVLKYHRNMTLEPMNAYERHVIHTALQEYDGVYTFSTGNEPNRRVVVACGENKSFTERTKKDRGEMRHGL